MNVPLAWAAMDADERSQYWATLALRHTRGIGPRSCRRLLKHFGSALAAVNAVSRWAEVGVGAGKSAQMTSGSWRTTAKEEWKAAAQCKARVLLWHHAAYPPLLRSLVDAPSLLYCLGDLSLLEAPCFAIVGSRSCTSEGVRMAATIARDLSHAGLVIVSGMARGIDRVAHMAALGDVGSSIAVLGTGIDYIYPQDNADLYYKLEQQGLIVTEWAPGTAPLASNFPVRNRIISGLSLGVLVVEGTLHSGSLVTAKQAVEQNRDVFAIPGAATATASRGCQELVRQGARPVFNADDILRDLKAQLEPFNMAARLRIEGAQICGEEEASLGDNSLTSSREMSRVAEEQMPDREGGGMRSRILFFLQAHGPCHVDGLCAELAQPAFKISAMLVDMEVNSQVKRLPGGRYEALVASV